MNPVKTTVCLKTPSVSKEEDIPKQDGRKKNEELFDENHTQFYTKQKL